MMRKFNKQEIFNDVVEHLFRQGGPALREREGGESTCVYRTKPGKPLSAPGNRACGIGGLIPDERYKPFLDAGGGLGASTPTVVKAIGLSADMDDANRYWLSSLQSALHDSIATPHGEPVSDEEFMAKLPGAVRTFATNNKLTVPAGVPSA